MPQEDLAELARPARQNLPACASETGPTRYGTPAGSRSVFYFLGSLKLIGAHPSNFTSGYGNPHIGEPASILQLARGLREARNSPSAPLLPNLRNRFGGQQNSEELNIMKGSAFIVGESRRVHDAD